MKVTRLFQLERPARKSGGDRYQEILDKHAQPIMGQTYIQQYISRASGQPTERLRITIETED